MEVFSQGLVRARHSKVFLWKKRVSSLSRETMAEEEGSEPNSASYQEPSLKHLLKTY